MLYAFASLRFEMNFISNLTILSLSRKIISTSPHFSVPLATINQKISFNNGLFQNLVSPFFYSPKQNNNLYLSTCTFQNFLDRAVHINQNQYINKTFLKFLATIKNDYDGTVIENCKFCGVRSYHLKGGAIFSLGYLKIRNSAFLKCISHGYGVIASLSFISVENTVFYKNIALFTSSIYSDSQKKESFQIILNSFSKCKSRVCLGIIYRPSPSDDFRYIYNNFSSSTIKGDYGSIIVNKSKTYFAYSVISNIKKSNLNCGIYIHTNYFTQIESCIFCNLSRTSTESNFGIALQITASENLSFISNCIFGKMDSVAPILFCSFNNVLVSNSCFFQKREEIAFLPFFDFVNCTYGKECPAEGRINLLTIIERKTNNQTNDLSYNSYSRNDLEYDLYIHFPFLLAAILVFLYILLKSALYFYSFKYSRSKKDS